MKLRHIVGASLLCAANMSNALAQETAVGPYLGFHVGQARVSFDNGQTATDLAAAGIGNRGVTSDESSTAWRLLAGYRFHRNFAAEVAYSNIGDFEQRTTATSVNGLAIAPTPITAKVTANDAFSLAGVAILPLNQLEPYAKLGFYTVKVEEKVTVNSFNQSESVTSNGVLWGLGLAFKINKNFAIRGEFERWNSVGDKDKIGESDVDFVSIGLLYHF